VRAHGCRSASHTPPLPIRLLGLNLFFSIETLEAKGNKVKGTLVLSLSHRNFFYFFKPKFLIRLTVLKTGVNG
jgi:hypothetical protein